MKQNFRFGFIVFCLMIGIFNPFNLPAQDRFPQPEFESEYQLPYPEAPLPKGVVHETVDVIVLLITLVLSGYFLLKLRSRRATFILMIFSLIYFGFIRHGCVCSIGAIQNVLLALSNQQLILPFSIIAFFCLPLIFTLFFGRTFCASVCPLGAMQDFVLLRPVKIKSWLLPVLGLIPHFYLGFSVLFALTGSLFLICRYDPFVSFFRLTNDFNIIVYSSAFLVLSVFIARPYCRFLCPYGVILGWLSRISYKHVTITPNECIDCRLCEDACPFDAIRKPNKDITPENKKVGMRRLTILIILIPVAMVISGLLVSRMHQGFSRVHPRVRLAERIYMEDTGKVEDTTLESRTFRSMGVSYESLLEDVNSIQTRFRVYGWWIGAYFGLIIMLKLIGLSIWRSRTEYTIDASQCVSCGRCFMSCPKEHERLKLRKVG